MDISWRFESLLRHQAFQFVTASKSPSLAIQTSLVVFVLTAPPVFVLLSLVGTSPIHVHVLSMSIVFPPSIAIVFGGAMRLATRP